MKSVPPKCYSSPFDRGVAFMKLCALLAGSLLLSCVLAAQHSEEPLRGPDGGTNYFAFVDGAKILPVAGNPFSARAATTESKHSLENGTVVTAHLIAMVARDSQGRIFREVRSFVRADSHELPPLLEIRIFDPVTHTRTACIIATRRCNITGYHAPTASIPSPEGRSDDGTYLEREHLGIRALDGLTTVGTRERVTTNAGVVSMQEFWYSPDLQINVSSTRKNREGTQVIQVGDLSREEPDPALFKIPPDFILESQPRSAKSKN